MASLNKVMLIGRLGRDPEFSYTTGGQALAKFNIATDEGYTDRQSGQKVDKAEWHRIVVWGPSAEYCSNYLSKGSLVYVEGKLQTRKWQGQDGQDRYTTEVNASRVQNLSPRSPGQGQHQGDQPDQGQYQGAPQGGQGQFRGGPRQGQQGGRPAPQPQQPDSPPQPGREEDLGPAFPSEAGGMDDVPF